MPRKSRDVAGKAGRAAVELRVSGASFADIADTLALADAREALRLVETALSEQLTSESVDVQRQEASARLMTLLKAVWERALDTDADDQAVYQRVALGLVDRHIRLNGLDRPTEITLRTPTAHELEVWIARVTSHDTPDVLEANVVGQLGP